MSDMIETLKLVWVKYKWWIIAAFVILVMLGSCGNASAQTCPTETPQSTLTKLDKAVKDHKISYAAVFEYTAAEAPNERMYFVITDKSGYMIGFYYIKDCMVPWPSGNTIQPLRISDMLGPLGKSKLVFEAGKIEEVLKIPGGQGA